MRRQEQITEEKKKRLETIDLADKLASKSKLTEKDTAEFSKMIKKAASKRFLEDIHSPEKRSL
jgi:hypothetical protein